MALPLPRLAKMVTFISTFETHSFLDRKLKGAGHYRSPLWDPLARSAPQAHRENLASKVRTVRQVSMSREAQVHKVRWVPLVQLAPKVLPVRLVLKAPWVQQVRQVRQVHKVRVEGAVSEQRELLVRKDPQVLKGSRVKPEQREPLVRQVRQDSKVKLEQQARREPQARRAYKVQLVLHLLLE